MPINRYLLKKEKSFANTIFRYFNQSRNKLKAFLIARDTEKTFNWDLEDLLSEINIWLALIIWWKVKEVINKWVSTQGRLFKSVFSIDWNLPNEQAVKYLDEVIAIHSSNIRNWSIWRTTWTRFTKLLRKWVAEWLSFTEIWKEMNKIDPVVFSKARAESIAIAELWNAYEYWKFR